MNKLLDLLTKRLSGIYGYTLNCYVVLCYNLQDNVLHLELEE